MEYRQCTRCLMDTTADEIEFDDRGICNYCKELEYRLKHPPRKIEVSLDQLVATIRKEGTGKPYDCIVGISGGVDSSFTLLKVKELGLRPLAVHMDNGWNSELAANNIKNLVHGLGVDLHTHVIDWQEYRQLMQAFFDADVIDIELLYDNAMLAVNYRQAKKYGIRYILAGTNTATEGMKIPKNWNWYKLDKRNIQILARSKAVKLKTFPVLGTIDYIFYEFIMGIKWISFLDYLPNYNKFDALQKLQADFGYKPYPYKHYESIFTRFYQGYILPEKFNVDKRKLHLSNLIISGQLTREEALRQMKEKYAYTSQEELEEDIQYFLKKMRWTREDLQEYLSRPEKPHSCYGSEIMLYEKLKRIHKRFREVIEITKQYRRRKLEIGKDYTDNH